MTYAKGGRAPLFSDSEIIKAAIDIQAGGGEVTPYTLVGLLGGGSPAYMKKALKRLSIDGKITTNVAVGEYDDILESITSVLESHKHTARQIAHNEFTKDRARLESYSQGLREELTTARSKLESVELSFKDLDTRYNEIVAVKQRIARENEELKISMSSLQERASALKEALTKSEAQSKSNLDRLQEAHNQFQVERRELLDKLSTLSASAQASVDESRKAENDMRHQIKQALEDGLKHINEIGSLRKDIAILDGGRHLLKRYKSWDAIAALCRKNK